MTRRHMLAGVFLRTTAAAVVLSVLAVSDAAGPPVTPERVILTPTSNPATAMGVTWRTASAVTAPTVQIGREDGDNAPGRSAREVRATTTPLEVGSATVFHHSATLDGLEPATVYAYRVGDGRTWSEWFHLRTAARGARPFRFLYFGDEQNDIRSSCSRVVRMALLSCPDARLMLHAGDLTTSASSDTEWGEWFDMAGAWNASVASIPAIGNHQYEKVAGAPARTLTSHWRARFALPENGVQGLEESCYFVDYQGAFLGPELRGEGRGTSAVA